MMNKDKLRFADTHTTFISFQTVSWCYSAAKCCLGSLFIEWIAIVKVVTSFHTVFRSHSPFCKTYSHYDSKLPQQRCPLLNTAIQMCSHLMHNYETSTVWCNSWNCCIENRGHICDQLPSLKQLWWGSMTLTRRWDAVSLQSLVGSRMRSSWHLHFYIHRIHMDRCSRRPALFWFALLIQWRSWVTGDGWISCHPC